MDPVLLTCVRLSKAGHGTPEQIYHMPVDMVHAALEYETFLDDYESTFRELNKQ